MPIGTPTTIGTNQNSSGATIAVTVPGGGVPTGALIVVCVADASTTFGGSVADTSGNTYALAVQAFPNASSGNGQVSLFYAMNAVALSSGNSVTYTKQTSGATCSISAFSVTGIKASAALDLASSNTGLGTATTITSGTPAEAGELFVGVSGGGFATTDVFTQDSGVAWAAPPDRISVTALNETVAGGTFVRVSAVALTYAPSWSVSHSWANLIATFKALSSTPRSRGMIIG